MQEVKQTNPYWDWQAREGLPLYTGLLIDDLNAVELAPWDRVGGRGAFVDLGLNRGRNGGGWVVEIPPGGALDPIRHMFDEGIYITQGRGATTIWLEGGPKQMVEWQEGSLVALPLNAWHQHFNTGTGPARFFSLNNMGTVLNTYNSENFIWENPFAFDDRFAGQDDYFNGEGELLGVPREQYKVWRTNFVPDARTLQLHSWEARGAGGLNIMLEMADTVCPHISQFPVGTYKKAHVHNRQQGGWVGQAGGGAQILILDGEGFTLCWPPGAKDFQKLDWKANSLIVAPSSLYHQHFNVGGKPARYLACIGIGMRRNRTGGKNPNDVSEEEGGTQIEYHNENPEVHRVFEGELKQRGVECKMAELSPFCTSG